jgi:hypothetical protein
MKLLRTIDLSFTSTTLWVLAFTLITPLMILAPAAFTTDVAVQTTRLPISQLAELIIPFVVIATVYAGMISSFLHRQSMSFWSMGWLMVSFLALGLLAMGQGIHFSAQTLNHFVITNRIFNELRDVAYLFNERLTHLIWLPPILSFPSVMAGWEMLNANTSKEKSAFNSLIALLGIGAGGWYGLVTGLAVLEAQLAKFAIQGLVGLLIVGLAAAISRKKLFSLASIINIVSLATMLGIILLWRLRYGGFPEPLDVLL